MANTFYSGKNGTVTADGTNIQVVDWTANFNAEIHDVTNTASGGYADNVAGILEADGTFVGHWDGTVNLFNDPPDLEPGNVVTATLTAGDSGDVFTLSIRVKTVTIENQTRGTVKYTVNWQSKGSYSFPT